ncbi:MAG: hypothetical protein R8G33_03795 [Gammaproteobacteria bacterium]|nr:hypothetical protein [Gammaproteobacteria bacterium]
MSTLSYAKFKCAEDISDDECKSKNKIEYCEYIDRRVSTLKRELQNGYDTYHHDEYRTEIKELTSDKNKYCE